MGNCLQRQKIPTSDNVDDTKPSLPSIENIGSSSPLNQHDITTPTSPMPSTKLFENVASLSNDSSLNSPTCHSHVGPLPFNFAETNPQHPKPENHHNPNQPIEVPSVSRSKRTISNTMTSTISGQSAIRHNNTLYSTPTQTQTVPSMLNTPHFTPSTLANDPSAIHSAHSLPPLSLAESANYSNLNPLEPTPQHSPDPQHIADIDTDIATATQQTSSHRKRASTHSGAITLLRAKTAFSMFSLNRSKINKNDASNGGIRRVESISSATHSHSQRKRGQTYHSPAQIADDMATSNKSPRGDAKDNDEDIISGPKLKRAQTLQHISHFIGFGSSKKEKSEHDKKSNKKRSRSKSISDRKDRRNHKGKHKNKGKGLKYQQKTEIMALECYAMEGNVKGIISVLRKYEKDYPPFFMEYSNKRGQTLLMKAAHLGHFGMMKYLINEYKKYKHAIFDSVEPSYGRDIASLVMEFMGDYINYESYGGKSALIFACSCKNKGRLNIVKYLLEAGASVANPQNSKHGKSPIIHAVEWKQEDLIDLLLKYGADINVKDRNNGFTPLMIASKFNNQDLCEFLLARGADKTLENKHGKTAIELAKEDKCWASLLALDPTQIPQSVRSLAAHGQSKNYWGRYSLSLGC